MSAAAMTSSPRIRFRGLEQGPRTGFEVTSLQGYQQDAESLDLSIIDAEYLIAV